DLALAERALRADDDAARLGLEPHDIERVVVGAGALAQRQAAALADGEAHDAVVPAHHLAVHVDDLAGVVCFGPELLHDGSGVATGYEAVALAVGLPRPLEPEAGGERARLALGHVAQGEAQ